MRTPKSTSCASEIVLAGLEVEMQMVEILRAVAVGPPQPRMLHVQRGRVLRVEGNLLRAVRRQLHLPLEHDVLNGALHHALHRLVADIFHRRLHGDVGRIESSAAARSVVTSGSFSTTGPVAER